MRVLVAGALTCDFIVLNGCTSEVSGGAPVHASHAYRHHDVTLALAFAGASADAQIIARRLSGVEILHQADQHSCVFENTCNPGEQWQQRLLAAASPLELPAVDFLSRWDLLHLSPLHHNDLHPDWYALPHPAIALDAQGLTRRIDGSRVVPEVSPTLQAALNGVRFLKASAREWALLSHDLVLSVDAVLASGIELLITDGAAGGNWYSMSDGSGSWIARCEVVHGRAVDPTGAGDMFFAAYLYHRAGAGRSCGEAADRAARFVDQALAARQSL